MQELSSSVYSYSELNFQQMECHKQVQGTKTAVDGAGLAISHWHFILEITTDSVHAVRHCAQRSRRHVIGDARKGVRRTASLTRAGKDSHHELAASEEVVILDSIFHGHAAIQKSVRDDLYAKYNWSWLFLDRAVSTSW